MKASEIIEKIEQFCPKEYAYSWDNVGLLCGDENRAIEKVYLTLDITLKTVQEAILAGADMIVSHHPILFRGVQRIDYSSEQGQMLRLMIQKDLVVYAAHTNMDVAPNGINQRLAELLRLSDIRIIEENPSFPGVGLGRIGVLKEAVSLDHFCEIVKKALPAPFVRTAGNPANKIRTVAIGSGSCSELIPTAIHQKADVVLTGDLKYHEAMDYGQSICLVDAGHYPTEICVMDIFEDILKDFKNLTLIRSTNPDTFTVR